MRRLKRHTSPTNRPLVNCLRFSSSPLFWVNVENRPSMKSARSKPGLLPLPVTWPSNVQAPELWNTVSSLYWLQANCAPQLKVWAPFVQLQSCRISSLARLKPTLGSLLILAPLLVMDTATSLEAAYTLSPKSRTVLLKSLIDWLTWCMPLTCVCAISPGWITKLCDRVALRVS